MDLVRKNDHGSEPVGFVFVACLMLFFLKKKLACTLKCSQVVKLYIQKIAVDRMSLLVFLQGCTGVPLCAKELYVCSFGCAAPFGIVTPKKVG